MADILALARRALRAVAHVERKANTACVDSCCPADSGLLALVDGLPCSTFPSIGDPIHGSGNAPLEVAERAAVERWIPRHRWEWRWAMKPSDAEPAPRRRHELWWWYFAFAIANFIFGFWYLAGNTIYPPASLAVSMLDFIGLFGLFHFIKGQAFLSRYLWMVVSSLLVLRLAVGVGLILYGLLPWRGIAEHRLSLFILVGNTIAWPYAYGLVRYAFLSRQLWRRPRNAKISSASVGDGL